MITTRPYRQRWLKEYDVNNYGADKVGDASINSPPSPPRCPYKALRTRINTIGYSPLYSTNRILFRTCFKSISELSNRSLRFGESDVESDIPISQRSRPYNITWHNYSDRRIISPLLRCNHATMSVFRYIFCFAKSESVRTFIFGIGRIDFALIRMLQSYNFMKKALLSENCVVQGITSLVKLSKKFKELDMYLAVPGLKANCSFVKIKKLFLAGLGKLSDMSLIQSRVTLLLLVVCT